MSLMAGKVSGAILNYLITFTRTLFDQIYISESLTVVLTLFADIVRDKRMQKSVWGARNKDSDIDLVSVPI